MKDLLIYVADADALAFLSAVLARPQALGIRPIEFDIERHFLRDAGMVQTGAELVRMKKGHYQKALLLWDHHGSGRDHKNAAEDVQQEIQAKLDSFTWKDNSATVVLVPELEQWLWFCESALAKHCGITVAQLGDWVAEYARKQGKTVETIKTAQPKELFEHVMRERIRQTISPRNFADIGKVASIQSLRGCPSFRRIVETLAAWFPDV